jgi:biopolymer transport protein ExbD
MELRRTKRRSVIINVTSLIDVMFILVLFFTVSTTFVNQPAMNLDLPRAQHSQVTRQSAIIVNVGQDGSVFLNDEPMDLALLEQALVTRLATADDRAVVLKADSRVSHGTVVHILDIIKGAGVTKLTIATQPSK